MLGVYDTDIARMSEFELPQSITDIKSVVVGGKTFNLGASRRWLAIHNGVDRHEVSFYDCLQAVKNKCKDTYGVIVWNKFLADNGMKELIEE